MTVYQILNIFMFIMNVFMMNVFINRKNELDFLERRYREGRAELIIMYGRRRVGKTYLIKKFLEGKSGMYLIVSTERVLDDFSRSISDQLGIYPPMLRSYRDLFRFIAKLSSDRFIVAVDEFQRLPSSFLLELQEAWDSYLSNTKVFLLLSGSSIGVIERLAMSSSSPIFGRRTGQVKLSPFNFFDAVEFMKFYPPEDRIRGYAAFGGTPAYLSMLSSRPLMENIRELIVSPYGPLHEEPYFLLASETREPIKYMSILEAVAQGATTFGEISSRSGVSSNELPRYLKALDRSLDLIRRDYPVLEERKGRARYHLKDNFFKFWFRFIRPNLHLIELGEVERVVERISAELDVYTSEVFEEVALEHFSQATGATRAGRWWRGEVEIDGVALDERRGIAYFMEAKWSRKPVGREVLRDLERKAGEFEWRKEGREEVYYIYARSFSFEPEENVFLITLEDMLKVE